MTALPDRGPIHLREEEGAGFDLARLASRAPRLALLVEGSSARADTRRVRSRLLLLLLSLACPRQGSPKRPWYVPGAVARLGVPALLRAWAKSWAAVPCEKTIRRHLRALEECLAIVRQPGDRLPHLRRPDHAPRHPDTVHVLDDELEAGWWERAGAAILRRFPEARTSPEVWRSRLGPWRAWARSKQLELFDAPRAPRAMPGHERPPEDRPAGAAAARLIARALRQGPLDLLEALRQAGAHVPARAQLEALRRPHVFGQAAALYALALARGDRVRDGWAWIRAALRRASPAEGARALRRLGVDAVETARGGGDAWPGGTAGNRPDPGRPGHGAPPRVLPGGAS